MAKKSLRPIDDVRTRQRRAQAFEGPVLDMSFSASSNGLPASGGNSPNVPVRRNPFHLTVFKCRRHFGLNMLSQNANAASQPDLRDKPLFARFPRWVERQVGRSSTFLLAIAVVLVWAASGPVFGWSDTWQLVINTGTTIVTFLMVFVIQNTQTRDTQAMQLKLDELIRVNGIARNSLINLEEMSEADVERMKAAFAKLASPETALHSPRVADAMLSD